MLKRMFDIIVAGLLLIFLLPFIPGIILLIRITAGNPILLKLPCVGKNERVFTLYIFNVHFPVHINIEKIEVSEDHSKSPMIEKLVLLFKFYLWPMLYNVIKGDLSLIGPNPESPELVEKYSQEQKRILSIRPGILNASFFCDALSLGQPMNFDLYSSDSYVKNTLPQKCNKELFYIDDSRIWKDLRLVVELTVTKLRNLFIENIRSGLKNYNFLIPIDILLIALSYLFAYLLRFDMVLPDIQFKVFFITLPIVIAIRILIYDRFGMYKNIWKYVGIRDLVKIIQATTVSSVLIATAIFFIGISGHSRSVFLIDWMFCISLIGGSRLILRLSNESINLEKKMRKNVLIIGAGDVGEMLLRELERTARDKYNIVGFIDDNKQKLGLTVHGVRVLGGQDKILEIVELFRVDEVFIAIALISASEIKSIINYCKQANVRHRIVPAVADSLNGTMHLSKIRKVEISDLFGRNQVKLDISAIQRILNGKRVLVTGAGGSIGSELCRQIAGYNPGSLILVDKSENYLHEIRNELQNSFDQLNLVCYLSDITNFDKQRVIFENTLPEIVFHAAARKHVPLGEENPDEAIYTNIRGTQNIAKLASQVNTSHFLLVSTDKAVNPSSIMGVSKRIAELYVQAISKTNQTKFIIVRFGNVLNSNGSVLPTFLKQIERGGPITVTHPDIERFFMSIDEAVQLILQSVSMGENGQIFILEMGKSFKILNLAEELIRLMGDKPYEDIDIQFTGIRPGEKMYEELVGVNEESIATPHAHIKTLQGNSFHDEIELSEKIEMIIQFAKKLDYENLINELKKLVIEFNPPDIHVDRLKNVKLEIVKKRVSIGNK